MEVFVQAVAERVPYIRHVIEPALARAGLPAPKVYVDTDRRGPLWNARRVWEVVAAGGEVAMVLQDDVVVHKDAGAALAEILEHVRRGTMQAVSLFVPPRAALTKAFQDGHNFVENYDFLWLQGILLTPQFCRGLVSFTDAMDTRSSDGAMSKYVKASSIPVWNCLPSLVQHDLNVKSTLGTAKKCAGVMRHSKAWLKDIPAGHFAAVRSVRNGRRRDPT